MGEMLDKIEYPLEETATPLKELIPSRLQTQIRAGGLVAKLARVGKRKRNLIQIEEEGNAVIRWTAPPLEEMFRGDAVP